MTDRYAVSFSPFGFESNVGTKRLRYAVTDHRPDAVSVYQARERAHVLIQKSDKDAGTLPVRPPFRHVAYCVHEEDAKQQVEALNILDKIGSHALARIHIGLVCAS